MGKLIVATGLALVVFASRVAPTRSGARLLDWLTLNDAHAGEYANDTEKTRPEMIQIFQERCESLKPDERTACLVEAAALATIMSNMLLEDAQAYERQRAAEGLKGRERVRPDIIQSLVASCSDIEGKEELLKMTLPLAQAVKHAPHPPSENTIAATIDRAVKVERKEKNGAEIPCKQIFANYKSILVAEYITTE